MGGGVVKDTTKIINVPNWKVPERYADRIVPEDRAATAPEILTAIGEEEAQRADKPVAVWLSAYELQGLYARDEARPYDFNQYILRKLRDAGAPVEGALRLKLSHGAVARVKPDPGRQEMGFKYIWLPEQHVRAIAAKGDK